MADASISVTPGVGANVDVSQVTREDIAGTVVDRQRVVIASNGDTGVDGVASVTNSELSTADTDTQALLGELISEVRLLRSVFELWTGTTALHL
jgi:hypothetical protein